MFFSEVKLSRKAWHYRLQCFILRSKPPFTSNFCPYFWITIFCMIAWTLVIPFYGLGLGIYYLFLGIERGMSFVFLPLAVLLDEFEDHLCRPIAESRLKNLSDRDIYFLARKAGWDRDKHYARGRYKYGTQTATNDIKKFNRWASLVSGWEEKLTAALDKWEAKERERSERQHKRWQEEEERLRAKELARMCKPVKPVNYAKIVKYTKLIVTPLAIILGTTVVLCAGAGISYLLFLFGTWVYSIWNTPAILACIKSALPVMGLGIIGALLIVALTYLVVKLAKCTKYLSLKVPLPNIPWEEIGDWLVIRLNKMNERIIDLLEIFIQYIKTFKQNHCPAIVWKDDE